MDFNGDKSNNNNSIGQQQELEISSSSSSQLSILITKNQNTIEYQNFIHAVKSPETKKKYSYLLFKYLDYLKSISVKNKDLLSLSDLLIYDDVKSIEADLIKYIIFLKQKQNLSYSSINNRLAAIYLFFEMNDIVLNKKKINRYIGEHIKTIKDRAYTREEIKLIVDNCSLKHKISVLLMSSSGCRIGAIPGLTLSALEYIEKYQLYKVTFYENTREEYYSFTTPEFSKYLLQYLQFRERCGEKLKSSSPLIRDDFIIDDLLHIENPKHITIDLLIFYLWTILKKTGIRKVTYDPSQKNNNNSRRPQDRQTISQNHGFRKFTHTTMANARISPEIREMLLGHSIGLGDSYYRPTEDEMLSEYLKVVDTLTINEENRLQKQVQELKEQDNYQKYVIDKKIKEKDEEIAKMKQAMRTVLDTVDEMRNDFITKQNEKVEKDKKIDNDFRKIESRLFETQVLALKLDEVDQKRQEMYATKGFVTKEDEETIKNSIIEDVKQNDPDLWHMLFERQQQEQEQQ
jgi:integrase